MIELIKKFEKTLIFALVVMMAIVLLLATIELGWIIVKDIVTPPLFLLEIDELIEIFGLFMLVLIGIELLETIIKTYLDRSTEHVTIVLAVALIAIARKVIVLDVQEFTGEILLGIAAVIIALAGGYYLIRRMSGKSGEHG
ncbi:MAG: phosphate-starvation-inducible E-like protein [Desulfobulbaceae bacterium]|nr:MAG: phosphate-starvation-inducible E-like protein [Desulfobulbaceae bacterium]